VLLLLATLLGAAHAPAAAQIVAAETGGASTGGDRAAAGTTNASPGPNLSARVRAAVATRWEVEPGTVRLEWGSIRNGAVPAEDAEFELVGEGVGGNWIVNFRPTARLAPPLRVWLRAGVEVEEAVAARNLEREVVLELDDITTAATVRWGGPEPAGATVAAGGVTKRQLRAGEPLREPAVAPPLAVRTGELVQALWRGPGIALTVPARALGSGKTGARVMVRTESGRRLEGTIRDTGLVEIDAPPEVKP
jgi:flagella basal body P-ring formation protein FlgA